MSLLSVAAVAAVAAVLAAPAKTAATPAAAATPMPAAARGPSVGIFTEVSGPVDIVRARPADRPRKAARVGFALHAGDEVRVGEGGKARIVVQSKCESVLASGSKTLTVTAEGVKAAKGKIETSRLDPCLGASYIDLEPDSSLRAGAGRLRGDQPSIAALEPADLKVCTTRPRFRWKTTDGIPADARMRISVLARDGTERAVAFTQIGKSEAVSNSPAGREALTASLFQFEADYPSEADALVQGLEYRVRYEVLGEVGASLARVEAPFRVASAKEMETLARHRTSEGGATLLSAMFADDFGCYVEALRDYRSAVGDDPPDNVSVRILWLSTILDAGDESHGP